MDPVSGRLWRRNCIPVRASYRSLTLPKCARISACSTILVEIRAIFISGAPRWSAARYSAMSPATLTYCGVAILRYLERRREAHLSTQPACSQTASRVPQADGDERRPPGAGSATRERPQKAIGVSFCPRGPANRLSKHLRNARSFCVSEAEHVGVRCPLSWRPGHVAWRRRMRAEENEALNCRIASRSQAPDSASQ